MTPNPVDLTRRAAGLWLHGVSLGLRVAILPMRLGARVADAVGDRLTSSPPPAPVAVPVEEPPPAPVAPSPKQRRRAARREPTPGQAARTRRARADAEQAAAQPTDALPSPGAEVDIAEPWEGYAAMSAADVVDRLGDADPTTRAAVRLYEQAHDAREAVLHATED